MADFKSLNGFMAKDEYARDRIANLEKVKCGYGNPIEIPINSIYTCPEAGVIIVECLPGVEGFCVDSCNNETSIFKRGVVRTANSTYVDILTFEVFKGEKIKIFPIASTPVEKLQKHHLYPYIYI